MDRGVPSVAIVQPCIDLRPHGLLIRNATVEATPSKDAEFNLRNVEPAAVLGCVVDLEPSCDGPGPVLASAPRGGLDCEERLGDVVADVFVLPARGLAGGDGELAADLADELLVGLVHAENRFCRSIHTSEGRRVAYRRSRTSSSTASGFRS